MQKWGSADLVNWVNAERRSKNDFCTRMVSRVAEGKAAREGVLQEGSMGGHCDRVSGTTVATPGR